MVNWLSKMNEEDASAWGETMLAHSFDQTEWKESRNRLLELLQADGKAATENAIRSYLCCCAESAGGAQPLRSLLCLVEELYAEYGMESSENSRDYPDSWD